MNVSYCSVCGAPYTHNDINVYEYDRQHLLDNCVYNTAVHEALDRMIYHDTVNCHMGKA